MNLFRTAPLFALLFASLATAGDLKPIGACEGAFTEKSRTQIDLKAPAPQLLQSLRDYVRGNPALAQLLSDSIQLSRLSEVRNAAMLSTGPKWMTPTEENKQLALDAYQKLVKAGLNVYYDERSYIASELSGKPHAYPLQISHPVLRSIALRRFNTRVTTVDSVALAEALLEKSKVSVLTTEDSLIRSALFRDYQFEHVILDLQQNFELSAPKSMKSPPGDSFVPSTSELLQIAQRIILFEKEMTEGLNERRPAIVYDTSSRFTDRPGTEISHLQSLNVQLDPTFILNNTDSKISYVLPERAYKKISLENPTALIDPIFHVALLQEGRENLYGQTWAFRSFENYSLSSANPPPIVVSGYVLGNSDFGLRELLRLSEISAELKKRIVFVDSASDLTQLTEFGVPLRSLSDKELLEAEARNKEKILVAKRNAVEAYQRATQQQNRELYQSILDETRKYPQLTQYLSDLIEYEKITSMPKGGLALLSTGPAWMTPKPKNRELALQAYENLAKKGYTVCYDQNSYIAQDLRDLPHTYALNIHDAKLRQDGILTRVSLRVATLDTPALFTTKTNNAYTLLLVDPTHPIRGEIPERFVFDVEFKHLRPAVKNVDHYPAKDYLPSESRLKELREEINGVENTLNAEAKSDRKLIVYSPGLSEDELTQEAPYFLSVLARLNPKILLLSALNPLAKSLTPESSTAFLSHRRGPYLVDPIFQLLFLSKFSNSDIFIQTAEFNRLEANALISPTPSPLFVVGADSAFARLLELSDIPAELKSRIIFSQSPKDLALLGKFGISIPPLDEAKVAEVVASYQAKKADEKLEQARLRAVEAEKNRHRQLQLQLEREEYLRQREEREKKDRLEKEARLQAAKAEFETELQQNTPKADALRDSLAYRWLRTHSRGQTFVNLLLGNPYGTSAEHIQEYERLAQKMKEAGYIVLHDGDSSVAPSLCAILGTSGLAVTAHPETATARGLDHWIGIKNPYLRLQVFKENHYTVISADSITGSALQIEGRTDVLFAPDAGWKSGMIAFDEKLRLGPSPTKVGNYGSTVTSFNKLIKSLDARPERTLDAYDEANAVHHLHAGEMTALLYEAGELIDGIGQMKDISLSAAVFGGASAPPEFHEVVQEAVGSLAKKGYAIATGGSGGFMAIANEVAQKAGVPSIGIPLTGKFLKNERSIGSNLSLTIGTSNYATRIPLLLDRRQFVLLAPGGRGTMKELATTLMLFGGMPAAQPQIVFLGAAYYAPLYEWLSSSVLPAEFTSRVHLVKTEGHAKETLSRIK